MRKLFPGYYSPDDEETALQWTDGIFIFDTSVLLNLYSYPEQAREEFLNILKGLADRTWIPYQVMVEFHRNRYKRINSANRSVLDLKTNLEKMLQTTKDGFSAIQFEKRNTGVSDIDERISAFDLSGQSLLEALEKACKRLNRVGLADEIALRLATMYEEKIGSPPESQVELDKLVEGADERFEKKIPPGFADLKDKTAVEFHGGLRYETKYGDLVVWRQIINHVKTVPNSRVVLVTAERKSDFWLKDDKDRIIGPLPELINEFLSEAKAASFWLYSAEDFLREAKGRGGNVVSADTINDVRDISLKYDLPEVPSDPDSFYEKASKVGDRIEPIIMPKRSDLAAINFITGRFPGRRVKRLNNGWVVDGSDFASFIQPLILDSVDPTAISKFANELIEPIVYTESILLLMIPNVKWRQLNVLAVENLKRILRKIMASNSIAEIVVAAHDELMRTVELIEIKVVDL